MKVIQNIFSIYYLTAPQPTLHDNLSHKGSLTNQILITAFLILNLTWRSPVGNQITRMTFFTKMKQGPFTETYISTVFGIFSLFQISKAVNKNLKVSWRETLLTNKRVDLLPNWFRSIHIYYSSGNFIKLHVLTNRYCKIVLWCEQRVLRS